MRRFVLVFLVAPAALRAQERAYDPAPLMAAAIEAALTPPVSAAEVRETARTLGVAVPEGALDRKYQYKVSRMVYSMTRPDRRDSPGTFSTVRRQATENATLASDIAMRVGLPTTADAETEEKACSQIPDPEGRTGGYTVCRYAQTDGVVAASMPVVSGDTARVDVMMWSNHPRTTRGINIGLIEVTLLRRNNVWTVVGRRSLGGVDG
jgi:hypothetical protein